MTFLSISPEAFDVPADTSRATPLRRSRPSAAAQLAAMAVLVAGLTVPAAVVQAKWNRLAVVVSIVQQRCLAALSA